MTTYTKSLTNAGSQPVEITLGDHQVFHLDGGRSPMSIKSVDGILWVTLPNDPEDHILKPGDHLLVNTKGKVVMQAITKASFSLN